MMHARARVLPLALAVVLPWLRAAPAAAQEALALQRPAGTAADAADQPLPIQGEKSTALVLPEIVITGKSRQNLDRLVKDEVPSLTSVSLQSTFAEGGRKYESVDTVTGRKEAIPVTGGRGCLTSLGLAKLFRGDRGRFDTALRQLRGGNPIKAQGTLQRLLEREPAPELAGAAHFWLGEIAFQNSELDTAAEQYRLAAEAEPHPFQAEALYSLGWLLAQRTDFDAAIRPFQSLVAGYPEHDLAPLAQLHLAEAHFLARRYRAALREFQQILALYPQVGFKDEAQFWSAECLYRLGRYEEAARAYQTYSENFSTSRLADDALYGLGYALLRTGQREAALEAFQGVLLAYPNSPLTASAMSRIGDIYVAERRFDKAATAYNEVIEKFPTDEGNEYARYRRIFMHHVQDDPRIVLELAKRFLEETPRSPYAPEVLFLAAEAHTSLDDLGKALAFYRQVAQTSKPSLVAGARFRAGLISFLRQDYEVALADFELLRTMPEAQRLLDEVLFWRAETLYRLGRYDEALGLYQRTLASEGQHDRFDDALFGAGWVHLRQGRFAEAAEAFAELERRFPTSPLVGESEFRLGQALFYAQRYSDAVATLERFLGSFPTSPLVPQALYVLGQTHQRREAFAEAVRRFQQLARSHPSDPLVEKALYQTGVSQLRLADFQAAAATFTELATGAQDPDLARRALLKGADSLYNLGRYEEAQLLYRQVIQSFPDSPEASDAQYGIGLAYYRMGRFQDFIDEARQMMRDRPQSEAAALVQLLIGEQLYDRRELERAVEAYRLILERAPKSQSADDALYRIGMAYRELGQPDEAASALRELLMSYPTSPLGADALLHLGQLYETNGLHREAADAYGRLVREYPNSALVPEARLHEGVERYRSGDLGGAEQRLKEVIARYTNSDVGHRARLELGLLYLEQQQDCGKAIDLFTMALRTETMSAAARAQFYVGECLARLGRAEEAVAAFMKVAYLYPDQGAWSDRAQFRAAAVYREAGQNGEALKILRKLQKETQDEAFRRRVEQEIENVRRVGR